MVVRKRSVRGIACLIALASFALGFAYALGAPVSHVQRVSFSKEEGRTMMTVITDGKPEIKLTLNRAANVLTARINVAAGVNVLAEPGYMDDVIRMVGLRRDNETGETLLDIAFAKPTVSYFLTSVPGQPGAVVNFRALDKPVRVTGIGPEAFTRRKPAEPADGAAPAAQVAQAALPAPSPAPEALPAQAAAPEAAAPEALVETAPAPLPVAPPPAPVVVDPQRFAKVDETFNKLQDQAGRAQFTVFMQKYRLEQYDEAVRLADEFLAQYPQSLYRERTMYLRAEALYILSKKDQAYLQQALAAFNQAIAAFPDSSRAQQAMMHKASLYGDVGFNIEALTEYGGLLRLAPQGKFNVAAMFARAQIYIAQQKFQLAYNELEKILLLYPNRREVRDVKYLIAESYFDRGQYEVAAAIFNEAIKQWPTFPKTHPATFLKIAETNFKLGNKRKAMEDWFSIVNLFPTALEGRKAMLRIGEVYGESNQQKAAAATFERLIRQYPKNNEAILARLRLASLGVENPELVKDSVIFDYQAFADPLATFEEVIRKYPGKEYAQEALKRKGRALAIQKRYVASIMAFKELLREYPAERMSGEVFDAVRQNFLKMIDTFYAQEGFFTVLLTYYNNFDPFLRGIEDPRVLVMIADSYQAMTLHDRAIEYYRLTSRFDEQNSLLERTAFSIAQATLSNNDYAGAERLLRRFLRQFPNAPQTGDARHLLGDTLDRLERPAEAATEWRIAVERDPRNPRAPLSAYYLGLAYKEARQYALAFDAFNRAIDSWSPSVLTGAEPAYFIDSHYQLAETAYLDGDYPGAIRLAGQAAARYPENARNPWMEYIVSSSYERVNKDEQALASLKDISERYAQTTIGKVAAAKLSHSEWKRKNQAIIYD